MTWDSVAEVDAPGKRGWLAVGVVGEAGEEAANAADGDADTERNSEKVSGTRADGEEAFYDFNGPPAAQQAAHNRLAAAGDEELVPMPAVARGLLQQAENAASEQGANGNRGDNQPAAFVGERVTLPIAHMAIDKIAAEVSKGFENKVELGMEDARQVLVSVPDCDLTLGCEVATQNRRRSDESHSAPAPSSTHRRGEKLRILTIRLASKCCTAKTHGRTG